MTIESPGRDVVAVQMLRGIAATMVLFVHIDIQLDRLHYGVLGTGWLSCGVDIFFVISGFIMWTSVERRGGMSGSAFLKNRLIRIVPLYWFVTTIVLLVGLTMPHVMATTKIELGHVAASYLFLPARHPVTGVFWPLLIPGWSLNYEMLFYVIFASARVLAPASRAFRFWLIAGLLSAIVLIADLTKSRVDVMNFYASPMIFEFVAGILLGIIWRRRVVRRSPLWLTVLLGGFFFLWPGLGLGTAGTMAGATLIVAGAVFLPPLPHNPLSSLGDASYSLYLTHAITLRALAFLWGGVAPFAGWRVFVVTGVAAAILVAFLMYRFFEVPVTARLKRLSVRPGNAAIAAPVSVAADQQS